MFYDKLYRDESIRTVGNPAGTNPDHPGCPHPGCHPLLLRRLDHPDDRPPTGWHPNTHCGSPDRNNHRYLHNNTANPGLFPISHDHRYRDDHPNVHREQNLCSPGYLYTYDFTHPKQHANP